MIATDADLNRLDAAPSSTIGSRWVEDDFAIATKIIRVNKHQPQNERYSYDMRMEQKVVAIGAASGIVAMIALVALCAFLLSAPMDVHTLQERFAFALHLNVIALIPFFVMLIVVGNSRFLSDAIDPTLHSETQRQEIDGRVAENTLQQNFVFLVNTLALSTLLPADALQILYAVTIVFILARIVFWLGYRMHPLYRAPGMSATAYMNLGMILTNLWLTFF